MNTAAYSRFSNVLCERKNGILGIIVSRLVEEDITDGDVALDWDCCSKELFTEFWNANMLPAREPTTQSETVRRNLNALHSARCEYMKNESNVKIQRALLHNIGDGAMKDLNVGDIVFYKRNDDSKWKCPGKIIGKDSKVYLVRHCVNCIRCHVCMLQKDVRMRKSVVKEGVPMVKTNVEARVNYIDHGYGQIQINVEEARDDDDVHNIYGRRQINVMKARIEDENGITSHVEDEDVSNSNEENVSRKHELAKPMEDIGDTWKEWKVVEDDHEVLFNINSGEMKNAKRNEINNWKENKVFEEVEDHSQRTISTRWVVTEKMMATLRMFAGTLSAAIIDCPHRMFVNKHLCVDCKTLEDALEFSQDRQTYGRTNVKYHVLRFIRL
ncbi:unnamed protein product [Lepeophtheirus salmonis]|uniref:(salmon louse) hypothetical protein n=2 Tax=Lepeophtheirus salmonis TaxID=72036 RepID=A0A7R8CTJ2_LEPSM|nr:unnamed protein product [Lepeophtheirus salmonis]CAF2926673.1 unnamed protein product [Lepeophtheirus salmonis]